MENHPGPPPTLYQDKCFHLLHWGLEELCLLKWVEHWRQKMGEWDLTQVLSYVLGARPCPGHRGIFSLWCNTSITKSRYFCLLSPLKKWKPKEHGMSSTPSLVSSGGGIWTHTVLVLSSICLTQMHRHPLAALRDVLLQLCQASPGHSPLQSKATAKGLFSSNSQLSVVAMVYICVIRQLHFFFQG